MPTIIKRKQSLVFIVANEEGRISWNGRSLNPFTVYGTFLEGGADGTAVDNPFDFRGDVKGLGLQFKKKLTERMKHEAYELGHNPNSAFELRKEGLIPTARFEERMQCFQNKRSGDLGYVVWLRDDYLKYLGEAGLQYTVLKKEQFLD